MTKKELAEQMAEKLRCTIPEAERFIKIFAATVKSSMIAGNQIYIRGFATFQLKTRKSKKARNIKAKTEMIIPEHKIPMVKFAPDFKDKIKELSISNE